MARSSLQRRSAAPFPEEMRLLTHCPVCNIEYRKRDIVVIEDRGETRLFHLSCEACGGAVLSLVITGSIGMSSIGMVTDLNVEDVRRLRKTEPVGEEALLNFHAMLRSRSSAIHFEEECVRSLISL